MNSDGGPHAQFTVGYDLSPAEISAGYDRIADQLSMPAYFYGHVADVALHQRTAPGAILDVGCGNGELLEALARRLPEMEKLIGIEPSPKLAHAAVTRLNGRGTIIVGRGDNLPFATGTLTRVLLTEVIEHVSRPLTLLGEVRRVLSDDGVLIATVPNMSAYEPFWRFAHRLPAGPIRRHFIPSEHPLKTLQPIDSAYLFHQVLSLFPLSGFRIQSVHGREFLPYVMNIPLVGGIIWRNAERWDALVSRVISPFWAYRLVLIATKDTPSDSRTPSELSSGSADNHLNGRAT